MQLDIQTIKSTIHHVRGYSVMLDRDLARFMETDTRVVNQLVKRNQSRFPSHYVFQLTSVETNSISSQPRTRNLGSSRGRPFSPYAYTAKGVGMVSLLLKTDRAIEFVANAMEAFADKAINERDFRRLEAKIDKFQDQIHSELTKLTPDIYCKLRNEIIESISQNKITVVPQLSASQEHFDKLPKENQLTKRIKAATADHFQLSPNDLMLVSRSKKIAFPRQIAMYLIREHLGLSFKEIAENFGLTDHTTAMHAVHKIKDLLNTDDRISVLISQIKAKVNLS